MRVGVSVSYFEMVNTYGITGLMEVVRAGFDQKMTTASTPCTIWPKRGENAHGGYLVAVNRAAEAVRARGLSLAGRGGFPNPPLPLVAPPLSTSIAPSPRPPALRSAYFLPRRRKRRNLRAVHTRYTVR